MKITRSNFFYLTVLLLIAAASAPFNHAQTLSATLVQASPSGPTFDVDGTPYSSPMSAFWPQGSVHTLWAPSGQGYAYNISGNIMWQFQGWSWSGGSLTGNPVQVIASPSITQYTANYSAQYLFTLQIVCNPSPCSSSPGTVSMSGVPVSATQSTWQAPGASIVLQAAANSGWAFAGWQPAANQSIVGFQDTVTLAAPMTVTATFQPAGAVNIGTTPPGLEVYADRSLITTPMTLPWGAGSSHALAGIDVQNDANGKSWCFASWSDGGAQSHTYVVPNSANAQNVTAIHAPCAYPLFYTLPGNLNLVVDGQTLPPPYSFIWGVGSTHTVSAPATQKDSAGNSWNFKSWDDNVTTPSRTVTIPVGADVNGYHLAALYTQQATLTVGGTFSGLTVTVDGSSCATPCSVVRAAGTQVQVSAPASVSTGAGSRQDFLGWSTGGASPVAGDWVGTLNANTTITATYHLMNQLATSSNPAGGATLAVQPASPDGFYDSQTSVTLGATAQPGYRFSNWSGDLSGSLANATLTMTVPHTVVAQLSRVPYITSQGVTSAVGTIPQAGVSPGSIATIFGASLANATVTGPASPLAQTLAGMTAHIGSTLLPLYYASPTQINLQIPPGLTLGPQTVTVSSQGMPDVNTTLNVMRNAPGLFPLIVGNQTCALVLHQDGSLVTPTAPALRGETLTLYATGLGATTPDRPEGIAVPATPSYVIQDPVTVMIDNLTFTPSSSFAAPGQVGLDLIQFQIDSTAPSGSAIPFTLVVNGVYSNTLSLPIQ